MDEPVTRTPVRVQAADVKVERKRRMSVDLKAALEEAETGTAAAWESQQLLLLSETKIAQGTDAPGLMQVESLQVESSGTLHRARSNIDELYYHEHRANPHPEASLDGVAVYQPAQSCSEFG